MSRAAGGLLARVALLLWAALVAVAACGPSAPTGTSVPVSRGTVSRGTVSRGTAARTVSAAGALSGVTPNGPGSVAVVPFVEAEAVMIKPRQRARVSVDAIPGLRLGGTVLAVAPSAVDISGVSNYYVTIVLSDGDPRLRVGQTVRATIAI